LDTFYAILIIVAAIGGVYVVRRAARAGVNATTRAANRRLLFRSEYAQGAQMVSAPVSLFVPAGVAEVMREVTAHVTTADLPLGLKAVVYESSRTADRITYALGNKLMAKSFEAQVSCASRGASTEATFNVLTWRETDGLVVGRETLEKLRAEVLAGFTAAGADAALADGLAIQHGPVPAVFTDRTGLKKYGFGAAGITLSVIAIVKFSVIGYYPSEVPLYFGMLIAGIVCGYVSTKMKIVKGDDVGAGTQAGGQYVRAPGPATPVHVENTSRPATLVDDTAPPVAAACTGRKAKFCGACGSPLRPTVAFCTSCGAKVVR
jgi:hypothetical protein